jgi:hypothetical protein
VYGIGQLPGFEAGRREPTCRLNWPDASSCWIQTLLCERPTGTAPGSTSLDLPFDAQTAATAPADPQEVPLGEGSPDWDRETRLAPRIRSRPVREDYSREVLKYRPNCLVRGFERKRFRVKQFGRYLTTSPVQSVHAPPRFTFCWG